MTHSFARASELYCDPARLRAQLGRPLVLGHRGLPGDCIENRLPAFGQALGLGADGVELDVQFSQDRVPVVFHDSELGRTTGQPGRLGDATAAELAPLGVPTLADVLARLDPQAIINVEIKELSVRGRGLEHAVASLVKDFDAAGRVLFSSFNPWAVLRLRRLDPRFYVAQLTAPGGFRWERAARFASPTALHIHINDATPLHLAAARERDLAVLVWGDRCETNLEGILGLDIDGVITDRPAGALRLLGRGS